MTRKELVTIIEKDGISCKGQRAVFILFRASLDRIICFGVTRGKQQTHASFDEWVPKAKQLTREESLAELANRYFASHGPATIQDYMWWSGLRASDASTGLEMIKSKLEQVTKEGKTYWLPDNAVRSAKAALPTVHLLPGFDEYLLGYKDRSASLAPKDAKKLSNGGGILKHTIMIDGMIAGIWSRTFKRDEVFIEAKFFGPLKKSEIAALNVAVERYGKLVTKSPTLHAG